MLPTTLIALVATLTTFTTAHNVRIYSDNKCTTDLNWAGLGQSSNCEPWHSWFSPGSFLVDANATDDTTIVVFIEGTGCDSKTKQYLVANATQGCTRIPGFASSMQVQNFTTDGDKKVPKGDENHSRRGLMRGWIRG